MKYLAFAALVLLLPCCKEPEPTPAVVTDAIADVDAVDAAADATAVDASADVSEVDAAAVVTPVDATSTEQ
jgi:hypothetical protein